MNLKDTTENKTKPKLPNVNTRRAQNWREWKSQVWRQNMQRKIANIDTLNGRKGKTLDIEGLKTNIIINTGCGIPVNLGIKFLVK